MSEHPPTPARHSHVHLWLTCTHMWTSGSHALTCAPLAHMHSHVDLWLTCTHMCTSGSHALTCAPLAHMHSHVHLRLTCTHMCTSGLNACSTSHGRSRSSISVFGALTEVTREQWENRRLPLIMRRSVTLPTP